MSKTKHAVGQKRFPITALVTMMLIFASSMLAQKSPCKSSDQDSYSLACDEGNLSACLFNSAVASRDYEFAECLIERGVSPDLPSGEHFGLNVPVIKAAFYGDVRFLEIIAKGKVNWEIKDRKYGMTALMWINYLAEDPKVVRGTYFDTLVFLIKHKANVNTSNNDGMTPLILKAQLGRYEFVRLLLENGADVNAQQLDGSTALMASDDDPRIVSALLSAGAVKELKDKNGRTAVLYAVSSCQPSKLKLLLDSGAAHDIKDGDGKGIESYLETLPDTSKCQQTLSVYKMKK